MLLPINKEPRFKIRIKKGYTLHIDGKYYQEGEEIFVVESQISDQAWKFDRLGVVEEETKESNPNPEEETKDADDEEAERLEEETAPKNKEESKRVRISQKSKEE